MDFTDPTAPPPWDCAYWDRPDPLAPIEHDPFTTFLLNEISVQRLRDLGEAPEELARQTEVLDRSYMQWRDMLFERWMRLDASRRSQHEYLRQVLPELLFWPAGAVLGPRQAH